MNFKEYVILEAKPDSELTKNEKEARARAKSTYEKDSARWRKLLRLPPRDPIPQRAWSKLQGDASDSGQKKWAKKIRDDVAAHKKEFSEGREVEIKGPYVTGRKWTPVTDPSKKRTMRKRNPPIERENVPSVRDIKKKEAKAQKESFEAAGRMYARSRYSS